MNKIKAFIKPIAGILAVAALIYFFPDISLYFAIAIILSMLGRPICERLKKFHIKKFHLGDALSAIITMVTIFLMLSLIFIFIIPLVNRDITALSNIDSASIVKYFENKGYYIRHGRHLNRFADVMGYIMEKDWLKIF